MKCKICGHRSVTLSAMAKHYRQKHPSKMKRHAAKSTVKSQRRRSYCPECGKPL